MSEFENIVPALAQALSARGYEALTPVQTAVSAPELRDVDLVVSAQTGSGKTVAFGLTMAANLLDGRERFDDASEPLGLVIAPTRELAMQVQRELEWLYAPAGGKVISCVGGMDARDERRALARGAHIVVGTPGRLVDHIRRNALVMHSLQSVVLDEADEMLNMGFREELEHILDASPDTRRTLMFSATMPRAIEKLAQTYQRDAQRVNTVSAQKQHLDIDYRALVTSPHDAENAIFNVLRFYDATNAIVFCATRAAVARMMSRFTNRGLSVVAISGELSQTERSHALQALRDHRAQVCIATDVAARGIDLPDLELVIHADLPKNTEGLLHRSGRTGRAGRKGTSVLIVPHRARKRTERLLRDAKVNAQWGEPPSADDVTRRDDERLMADPALSEPIAEADMALAQNLLAQHSPEQIAAAFVRAKRQGRAAPEDLAPAPPPERGRDRNRGERPDRPQRAPRADRADFDGGVWVSLSVGHNKNAEPRWLLPMLCKAGGLTKSDIGSIRIQQHESHVEMKPGSVDGFFEQVGAEGKLEKGIIATRLSGAPGASSPPPRRDRKPAAPHRKNRPPQREHKPRSENSFDPAKSETSEARPASPSGGPSIRKKKKPAPPGPKGAPKSGKPKSQKSRPSKTPPQNRNKRSYKAKS